MPNPFYSSPLLGLGVTLGNLAIWLGLVAAVACVVLYWVAMLRTMRLPAPAAPVEEAPSGNGRGGKKNGKRRANGRSGAGEPSPQERRTERVTLWARRCFFVTCGCFVAG